MFTGIIEELGKVRNIQKSGRVTLLEIEAEKALVDTKIGDSISVNGACLTVIDKAKKSVSFEVISQTLHFTNLGSLRVSCRVNLERALKLGDRVSGHFVTGHIDCVGIIRNKNYLNDNLAFEIAVATEFMKYILPKGSIAVDGISLTIVSSRSNAFTVHLIPHSVKNTTLGLKGAAEKVNIEFDILAKKESLSKLC